MQEDTPVGRRQTGCQPASRAPHAGSRLGELEAPVGRNTRVREYVSQGGAVRGIPRVQRDFGRGDDALEKCRPLGAGPDSPDDPDVVHGVFHDVGADPKARIRGEPGALHWIKPPDGFDQPQATLLDGVVEGTAPRAIEVARDLQYETQIRLDEAPLDGRI